MQAVLFWFAALIGHGAFWVEIVNRSHALGWPRKLVDALTALCGIAVAGIPLFAIAFWFVDRPESQPALPSISLESILLWYGYASLFALAVILAMRIGLLWDPRRKHATKLTQIETLSLAEQLGPTAMGSKRLLKIAQLPGNQVLQLTVEHRSIPLDRLPRSLDGLRIAHLTDLHMSGRLGMEYFQEVVQRINDWQPDMICLTGDLVEHTPQMEWIKPTLGKLIKPRLGSYFVLGNHDEKVDCQELRGRLSAMSLRDVGGKVKTLSEGITVCGDERPWFEAKPSLSGEEPFVICLAHTPDRFGWAWRAGIDLVLAGHTHGGQVCFPLLGPLLCPSRHGVRYASGTFRDGRTVMHVSRGTGSLFPIRFLCPPELSLLTLKQNEESTE